MRACVHAYVRACVRACVRDLRYAHVFESACPRTFARHRHSVTLLLACLLARFLGRVRYYFVTKLEVVTFVSGLTYFLYMYLVCTAIFIMTGFVGFACTAKFVHAIYGSLRVD